MDESKSLRESFKEFERFAEDALQANRAERVDGVGLLTPSLLERTVRKHAGQQTRKGGGGRPPTPDDTQVLVLAYGRKGATVGFTLRQLKHFIAVRERTAKRLKSTVQGIPCSSIFRTSDKGDKERAGTVKNSVYYQRKGNVLYFQVTGNCQPYYRVQIRLEAWNAYVISAEPVARAVEKLVSGRVSIECPCGRHQYWYRYLATLGNYAISPVERDFPKIRNPNLQGCACKHVLKTLRTLQSAKMRFILGKELEKDRKRQGYADLHRKTIAGEDMLALAAHEGRLTAKQAQRILKEKAEEAKKARQEGGQVPRKPKSTASKDERAQREKEVETERLKKEAQKAKPPSKGEAVKVIKKAEKAAKKERGSAGQKPKNDVATKEQRRVAVDLVRKIGGMREDLGLEDDDEFIDRCHGLLRKKQELTREQLVKIMKEENLL